VTDPRKSFARQYYSRTLSELRMMNQVHVAEGVTFNSVLYMDLIAYTEDCTVSKLAEMLNVSKASVTIKVNELVSGGFVEKTVSETDRRIHILRISEDAESPYREEDRLTDLVVKKMREKYSDEEMDKFCEMLDFASGILD